MTYPDAVYLKHSGNEIDVKVTVEKIGKNPLIFIRDLEIGSFKKALEVLRYIAETELTHKEATPND